MNNLKRFIRFELILIGCLSFIIAVTTLLIFPSDYPQFVAQIRKTPAPSGMIYMDYCDGRPSEQVHRKEDISCLADYPGEFAFAALSMSIWVIFMLFSLTGIVFYALKRG